MLGAGQSGPGPGKCSLIRMLTGAWYPSGGEDLITACPEGGWSQNWGGWGVWAHKEEGKVPGPSHEGMVVGSSLPGDFFFLKQIHLVQANIWLFQDTGDLMMLLIARSLVRIAPQVPGQDSQVLGWHPKFQNRTPSSRTGPGRTRKNQSSRAAP